MDLRRGHFSAKMYAKIKELGLIGGACAGTPPPLDPPMLSIMFKVQRQGNVYELYDLL